MVKYASNSFHALKVAFANEIGALSKRLGIDSHRVMDVFSLDGKLNISPAYLKPGFAFGGSCLPKDLRALLYAAKAEDMTLPVLASVLESNRLHIERAIDWVICTRRRKVGILGLSFKPGTDDLRESPVVTVVEALIGKGYQVKIFDSEVSLARVHGANKAFIETEIPHIASLMSSSLEGVLRESEVIVVCKPGDSFRAALQRYSPNKPILDLVRLNPDISGLGERYEGICW
jgi:GDP-mannose 6-dehydrogenase